MTKRWAVFISGTGSNMTAVLEKQNNVHVSCVVSSNFQAAGNLKALRRSLPVVYFSIENQKAAPNKMKAERQIPDINSWKDLIDFLERSNIDYILLAGFMKILPREFVERFEGRIFNIHPSLLPDYPGLNSIQRAFEDGVSTGVTLHQVDEGVDTGKIIFQKKIPLSKTLEETELSIHLQEQIFCKRILERKSEVIEENIEGKQ